jgi:hypothetical protein
MPSSGLRRFPGYAAQVACSRLISSVQIDEGKGDIKMKLILTALMFVTLLTGGCVSSSEIAYQNQLQDIEQAYQAGKITTAEYLTLKHNAENSYRQRKATIAAGVLASP